MDGFRVLALIFLTTFTSVDAVPENNDFPERDSPDILSRIEALEQKGLEQTKLIQLQRRNNDDQALQLSDLRSTLQIQNNKIVAQSEIITALREKVETQERLLAKLAQQTSQETGADGKTWGSDEKTDSVGEGGALVGEDNRESGVLARKGRIQRRQNRFEGPVAFLVRLQGSAVHLGMNQNVLFDTVVNNIGNSYHKSHGLFISPTPGIYIFSASVNSFQHKWVEVEIVKDGTLLSRAFAFSDPQDASGLSRDQGSTTAVTQLATGDEVWLRVHYPTTDANIWGDAFTSFTGCLVMPL